MNYADMSDFDINKAVASEIGYEKRIGDHQTLKNAVVISNGASGVIVDYCNCWFDAGRLIEKYRISLKFDESGYCYAKNNHLKKAVKDKRPLRAAMIAFLNMCRGE